MTIITAVFEPILGGATRVPIEDQFGTKAHHLNPVWTAWGGCWSLTAEADGSQAYVEGWLEEGLGRHIELYAPTTDWIWEGYVSLVTANIAGATWQVGPLLDTMANKIRVSYSTVDYNNIPPAVGQRRSTGWAEDATSQARYGIIEYEKSVAGATLTNAEQIRDVALAEMRYPRPKETDNIGGGGSPSVTIQARGYSDWLQAYHYTSTTPGATTASTKLQAVLGADPNGLFSADYTLVGTNTSSVGAYDNNGRSAMSVVQGLTAIGDTNDDRWLFGLYQDRRAVYEAIPSSPTYQRQLADPQQSVRIYGDGPLVYPWSIQPGRWLFYTDLFVGRSTPDDIRADERYLFIEQASFSIPWALTLDGSVVGRLDQILSRLGLGGSHA